MPFAFRSSPPGVSYPGSCLPSSDVLGAAIPPRLDFSIVDTVAYSRVPSEHSSSPRFESHIFCGGDVPTLLPQARLPRETISLCWGSSPPVDAVGRLVLSASTSSRINCSGFVFTAYVVDVFFTLTDRASTIPKNIRGCQPGTWPRRGTKVNGSHHGGHPLFRPQGSKSRQNVMRLYKQWHRPISKRFIKPPYSIIYREQPRSTRIVVAYPQPAFSATNRTNTFQPV